MTVSSTSETTPKRTSGPDDEHPGLDGLAALDRHRERLPSRLEPGGDDRVDDAAAIRDDLVRRVRRS